MPRALDGCRQLSLMPGTVARNAAWDNLAPIGQEIFQRLDIFIVDVGDIVGAETANFSLEKSSPSGPRSGGLVSFISHISLLFRLLILSVCF